MHNELVQPVRLGVIRAVVCRWQDVCGRASRKRGPYKLYTISRNIYIYKCVPRTHGPQLQSHNHFWCERFWRFFLRSPLPVMAGAAASYRVPLVSKLINPHY